MTTARLLSLSVLPALALPLFLQGCATSTKSTLLSSRQEVSLPIGPVHLPARYDGISFQGEASLQVNPYLQRSMAKPEEDNGLLSSNGWDSAGISGPLSLHQERVVFSGEGSVFLSRNFRLFVGMDATQSQSLWFGAGFSAGEKWRMEFDASMGSLYSDRQEVWRIQTSEYCYSTGSVHCVDSRRVVDSFYRREDTASFWKLNFTFAKAKGGPVVAYQLMDFPATRSPSGTEFSLKLHTFTIGYFKPTSLGTFAAFAQATNLGKSWSPSARIQYNFELGGNDDEED